MRVIAALPLAFLASVTAVSAPAAAPAAPLDGTWAVDLSVNPAQPYTKPMVLALQPGGTVTGSFYESEILAGRRKTDRCRTCVSFRTTDGAGLYYTAACLVGHRMEDQTWAAHRNFLFNWNAVRAVP